MELKLNSRKMDNNNYNYDVIIIGGGPAGLTAGIYLGRARLKTLLLENMIAGGQAANTQSIENYPGFPEGIDGPKLGMLMEKQAQNFDVNIKYEKVIKIINENNIKIVKTNNNKYKAKAIIIATGTQPRKLNIKGAEKFFGKGISYCATCDGPLFRDKDIVIIGGGNSAVEEGLFLLRFVKSITFVQELPFLTAEKILQERINKHLDKVKLTFNNKLISINGDKKIESITVEKTDTGKIEHIKTEGIFVYIGLNPNTEFIKDLIELNDYNYIKTNQHLETNIKGIYAAGDVIEKQLRQVATAVSDGAIAAFNITKYIENLKEVNNG